MRIEEMSEDFASKAQHSSPSNSDQPIPGPDLLTQAMNAYGSKDAPPPVPDGTNPPLPPGLAGIRDKTADEMLADLNKHPLFMTELEDNDELAAMQALAYEGSPSEVAENFKEQGNDAFKTKGWRDAKEYYGKAIQVLLIEVRKRQKGEESEAGDDVEEIKKEIGLLEACLVNRAACHLELQNYRSCTQDCASVLRINGKNVKAFYRSSKALLALNRVSEADDSCARGLAVDPENTALQAVAREIINKNEMVAARKKRDLERETRKRQEAITLKAALKARDITLRKSAQPPEMEDAKIELVPDPIDPTSTLSFPAVLLYPLHLESDFIKSFNETEVFGDHLSYIFPLPWDKQGVYTPNGVECYVETVTGGLVKVGRKVSLLKVLSSGNIEIVDEVVRIFVVPKSNAEAWVKDFKAKKAAEKVGP